MKTILVIFVSQRISPEHIGNRKRYSFNTDADVEEGMLIKSPEYDSFIQVVEVLDKYYKYYSVKGKLLEDLEDDEYGTVFPIKTLIIGNK